MRMERKAQFQNLSTFKLPALEQRSQATAPRTFGATAQRTLRAGYADVLVVGNGIAGLAASVEARRYAPDADRSEEHTSELQSHSFISYAVFHLKKKGTGGGALEGFGVNARGIGGDGADSG